ncbi:MAG: ATP-binding cassette domain-containing protein [Streptosporangiaceae bacterium]
MNATIEIDGLRKRFGPVQALDGMTFTVQPGHVTGFAGPNGAGKSTTMRVIVGLDAPNAGTATIGGQPYHSLPNPLTHVGSLLDAGALQPGRSARNHLLWLARSQGLTAGRVDEVIALAGLQAAARRKAGGYSLGMRQRLGIAAALLGDPQVLLLDEPVNGLDPEGVLWIRTLIKRLAAEGRTVLVSSHLMNEMAVTADHLIVIGRGRLLADCPVAEFTGRRSGERVLARTPDAARLARVVRADGAQAEPGPDETLVITGMPAPRIAELAARTGIALYELTPQRASLEEAFMELTADSLEYGDHGADRSIA